MSDELVYAILFNFLTVERPGMCPPLYDNIAAICSNDPNPCRNDSRCNVGEKCCSSYCFPACTKSLPEGKHFSVMQSECVLFDVLM